MSNLLKKKLGFVFILLQFLLTVGFIGLLLYVDMIPDKYLLLGVLALIFVMLYTFFSQMSGRLYIVGRVLSVFFCIVMIIGAGYVWRGYSAIDTMSAANVKVDELSAVVLASDTAETIDDARDYEFGIIETIGRDYTDSMLASIKESVGKDVTTKTYENTDALVKALYDKEVRAIIFNEAFRETITDNYKDFETATKVLGNHKIETVIEVEEKEDEEEEDNSTIKKPFIMYISGIDTYGSIKKTSRSDVNIIAVINPETSQILLVNTPRDYYVPLSISNGVCDKLTHAGIYGVDVSIKTLEELYDIDVDYYVRVNFSGLKEIVNALGGVSVYSDYDFTSDWGPSFKKGYNDVNGKEALAFCRERHHFKDGDNQRGRNHQHMISAILDKATSPSVLSNFNKLMKSLEDSFETNMKTKKITKYVKYQMDEMPKWKIDSISVDGYGTKAKTYSITSNLQYVMKPNVDSVNTARSTIKKVLNGEKIKSKNKKSDKNK